MLTLVLLRQKVTMLTLVYLFSKLIVTVTMLSQMLSEVKATCVLDNIIRTL